MKTLLILGALGVGGYFIYKYFFSAQAQAAGAGTSPKPAIGPGTASPSLCKAITTVGGAAAAGIYGVPPALGGAAGALASGPICNMGKTINTVGSLSNKLSLGVTGSLWNSGKNIASDIGRGNIGAAAKDTALIGVNLVGSVGKSTVSTAKAVVSKLNPFSW